VNNEVMVDAFEGPVTVMFTDIEGSTEITAELGNEAARDLFRRHDEVVRAQIKAQGGQEIKAFGDGFMVAFRQPSRAVQAAVEIQRAVRPPLRVRIGINTGEVQYEEGDLYGEAVNASARIADKAAGGEILISDIVKSLLGRTPDIELSDRGRLRLKGFPDRWRLWEVAWEPARPRAHERERTAFIGRDEERAQLRRLMENAAGGSGALVLIGGEPGVGKTRLAAEISEEAALRGFLAFTGRCYESEGTPPYIAFTEILEAARRSVPAEPFREALGESAAEVARIVPELRTLFPDIPPPLELPPEQERHYLLNSVRDFVERAARIAPMVVVLDDLHWADDSTLMLVERIAEKIHEFPALFVGTYRDVELDVERPLARTLDDLLRRRLAQRISLRRLGSEGVEEMLRALSGQEPPSPLVKVIYGETEGNPFFVEEVFKHLVEEGRLLDASGNFRADLRIEDVDVPEGVRLVIGRRLQRLGEAGRKALTAAAVVGKAFSYDLLATLEDVEEEMLLDAMDDAQAAGLIAPASQGPEAHFVFSHELIRQTLLANVALPRRQRLHLRIAEAIERSHGDSLDEWAADVGHHLFQAGTAADPGRTSSFLTRAGDRSFDAAAFEEALRFYEDAMAVAPESEARTDLLSKIGAAHRGSGQWERALEVWRELLDLYEGERLAEKIGPLCWDIAQGLGWAGRWGECIEICARGLAALEDTTDPYRPRLLGLAAVINAFGGSRESAEALWAQALELIVDHDDPVLRAYADLAEALIHFAYMAHREMIEAAARSAPVLRDTGNLRDYVSVMVFLTLGQMFSGDPEGAQRSIDEIEGISHRLGYWEAVAQLLRVQAYLDSRGQPDFSPPGWPSSSGSTTSYRSKRGEFRRPSITCSPASPHS
jgi:class 3 adenylate cyclase/tetratricopeptide (TPR) repeat protein